ncbi:MAG: hypothetical protein WKG00_37465 [Polyangiaceae bacterium]
MRRLEASLVALLVLSAASAARAQPGPPPIPQPQPQPMPVPPPTGPQPPQAQPGPTPGQPLPPPGQPAPPPGQPAPPPGQPAPPPTPPPPTPPLPPVTQPAQPPPQPPPTWGQPSPYPPPSAWAQPAPAEPTDEAAEEKRGVRGELPLGRRGQLAFDTATFASGAGGLSTVSLVVDTSFPVAKRTFIDARLPLGYTQLDGESRSVLGNAMVGAHYVGRTSSKRTWWSVGGGFGLPLLDSDAQLPAAYAMPTVPRGLWDMHEYTPDILPFNVAVWVETHIAESTLLRFEVEPVTTFPLAGGDEVELSIQHAVEIQFGHALGGGVRLQGAAFPTYEDTDAPSFARGDLYQLALEPFFVIERRAGFLRTGLMLPLDGVLGPPLGSVADDPDIGELDDDELGAWGFRLTAGVRIE